MDVDISLDQLQSFLRVAELKSVSKSAKSLGITQPALSIKIKHLEIILERILFMRSRSGMQLTADGENLVRYAHARFSLQQDLASGMFSPKTSTHTDKNTLVGMIRVAGHFSIIRHGVIPSLNSLYKNNRDLQLHAIIKEDKFVPDFLRSNQTDFAILVKPIAGDAFEGMLLGYEEYVVVESSKGTLRENVYLDSDPFDTMTELFFTNQPRLKPKAYVRSFFHDETGIAQAVILGFGRAVLARREAEKHAEIRILEQFKSYFLPAYLYYPRQIFYSRAQVAVRENLIRELPKYLIAKKS